MRSKIANNNNGNNKGHPVIEIFTLRTQPDKKDSPSPQDIISSKAKTKTQRKEE